MYYIGEGDLNLRKMDKFLSKSKTTKVGTFSSTIINDASIKKARKNRFRIK